MDQLLGSRYVLHEPIGRGGMGQVFRGSVRETEVPVAVKMLMPELVSDPDIVARFFRERSILLSIDHPNVVRVIDLVVEGQTLAIVMELVEGKDLRRELLARRTLPPPEAAAYCRELLDGLIAVHNAGIVHRDVKPENVLIDKSGPEQRLKLTDFGVARLTYGTSLTKLSSVIGTPDYMAPEIVDHETATPAADLYSTGIVLYEMLAGRTPFSGGHPIAVLHRHLSEEPPPIANAPLEMWKLIESLLAKDPESRPQSASQVADMLAAIEPSLTDLPALPVMPEPVFQPVAQRRATPHPLTEIVRVDPMSAAETVLRPTDPGRTPKVASIPAGPPPTPAGPPPTPAGPPVRPVRRGRFIALGLSAALLVAAAATAFLIVRHPSASLRPDAAATTGIRALAITPATVQMRQNQTSQLMLTGQRPNGSSVSSQDLASAVWSTADPSVATVGEGGTVTAIGPGSTYITARIGSSVTSARVFVAAAPSPTPSTTPTVTVTVNTPVVVTVSPTPSGSSAAFAFQIFHSCRAGNTCGVAVRSGPGLSYQITGSLANNQPVEIVCQTSGDLETNSRGISSYVWDELQNGGYISDLYVDTQGAKISPTMTGFDAGIPGC